MTTNPDVNYSSLANEGNPFRDQGGTDARHIPDVESPLDTDNEETPRNSGIMIHVVPEANKARWNHIEDLDSFFTRMYCYHQKHGFKVIMLQEILELGQFIYVIFVTTYLFHCVNFPVLFGETKQTKITFDDIIIPTAQCVQTFGGFTWFAITLSALFWFFRLIKFLYHFVQFWDIKKFYNTALKIDDSELDNLTWHEVQKKIRDVQSEQQMCIHKDQLTELDIYHRILRFKNYMVAMMNKNLLPGKIMLPLVGEAVCFSQCLRYNIELILFRGPWSPFENNWNLREEFKRTNKRVELAQKLSRQILLVAIANLALCPLVFLWQAMYLCFSYADLIKRDPSALGIRCWSLYGKLYLRHFNELEHELNARLSRAYRPAVKYMESFSSPLLAVIARSAVFVLGGIFAVATAFSIYDTDVIRVEYLVPAATLAGLAAVVFRVFIPDENLVWCPEQLLTAVLAHVHYLPVTWRGLAHTTRVRDQFGNFFQFKSAHLINELVSPLITPFILMYTLRPRALDIVDFFRNFTVSVVGVGDVCSFAQMDVRKHGNPDWQPTQSVDEIHSAATQINEEVKLSPVETNQYTQGEHGKTELSLVHFTLTNPEWKMPSDARHFVRGLRRHAIQDLSKAPRNQTSLLPSVKNNPMCHSLMSFGSLGEEYSSVANSIFLAHNVPGSATMPFSTYRPQTGTSYVHSPDTHAYDFEHMLHENLYDGSTTRSHLRNIQEGETEDDEHNAAIRDPPYDVVPNIFAGRSMDYSMRGSVCNREGSRQGPKESLVLSLHGYTNQFEVDPTQITTADMCLSTLYLHELHHRHLQRRGGYRLDHTSRQLWQKPHQQPISSSSSSMATTHPPQQSQPATLRATSVDQINLSTPAVERTPLLGQKKS